METTNPAPFSGGCLCGQVRYAFDAEPRVHFCHCGMCRRATGSAFAVFAWVDAASVRWEGTEWRHTYRSSSIARREFCSCCGTALTLRYDGSDEIALHVGTLDDPARVRPEYHYGAEYSLAWADCGAQLPRLCVEEQL